MGSDQAAASKDSAPKEAAQAPKYATVTPVNNNRESLIQIQLPGRKQKDGSISQGKVLDLLPGMNFPDTSAWKAARENPMVKLLLESEIEASIAPEQNPEKVGQKILVERAPLAKDNPLKQLNESDAKAIIAEMFDTKALNRFIHGEERGEIVLALRAQIRQLEKPRTRKEKAKPPSPEVGE